MQYCECIGADICKILYCILVKLAVTVAASEETDSEDPMMVAQLKEKVAVRLVIVKVKVAVTFVVKVQATILLVLLY